MPVDSYTYYRTYGPMVLRRCRKLLGDEQAARDAMHDVFVQVLSRAGEFADQAPPWSPDPSSPARSPGSRVFRV